MALTPGFFGKTLNHETTKINSLTSTYILHTFWKIFWSQRVSTFNNMAKITTSNGVQQSLHQNLFLGLTRPSAERSKSPFSWRSNSFTVPNSSSARACHDDQAELSWKKNEMTKKTFFIFCDNLQNIWKNGSGATCSIAMVSLPDLGIIFGIVSEGIIVCIFEN